MVLKQLKKSTYNDLIGPFEPFYVSTKWYEASEKVSLFLFRRLRQSDLILTSTSARFSVLCLFRPRFASRNSLS